MSARDLAGWAADAFATYDLATTHRIVIAVTGPGPLPDYVSARVDPLTGTVGLPRPVGVVLAREPLDELVRLALLTRNALLVETGDPERVRHLAALAEKAGAPAGVVQLLDGPAEVDAVLEPPADAPVVVIADHGSPVTVAEPEAVVLAVGDGYADLGHAIRAARGILRETGGDRIRVYAGDPLRIAAALPAVRVAVGDGEMPPPPADGLIVWTRIGLDGPVARQPWAAPGAPVPAYPRAANEP
ncbi:hypothetical protein BJ973_000581 [Actinoplanes tereljensis]|uniref:Uncharacterized protein n=1 Tax=Paractinoplanes tereljensis TaxID=571912 RepID=A0A919TW95_9ACTN|nr:hypothetical protein [Actinoplanes tereljensis]GIF23060.1 hypothetical protein Ate02nite_57900 [Actinoplanes tereljensis]